MTIPNKPTAILIDYVDSITDLSTVKASDIYSMLSSGIKRPKNILEQMTLAALNSIDLTFIDYYIAVKLDKQRQVENPICVNH